MKTVKETIGKIKGDNLNEVMTGKGAFSKTGFADTVNALVNDSTFKIPTFGKDGNKNGEVSVSELIRNDLKKTFANAKYPQKSEAGVIDTTEICTAGLAEAIPYIVMEQMKCGKKFDLPAQTNVAGSIYLAKVPAKEKVVNVRDPKTQANLGTCVITSKDSVQIRAKSPVPAHLQTKVRKDPNGKVIG